MSEARGTVTVEQVRIFLRSNVSPCYTPRSIIHLVDTHCCSVPFCSSLASLSSKQLRLCFLPESMNTPHQAPRSETPREAHGYVQPTPLSHALPTHPPPHPSLACLQFKLDLQEVESARESLDKWRMERGVGLPLILEVRRRSTTSCRKTTTVAYSLTHPPPPPDLPRPHHTHPHKRNTPPLWNPRRTMGTALQPLPHHRPPSRSGCHPVTQSTRQIQPPSRVQKTHTLNTIRV